MSLLLYPVPSCSRTDSEQHESWSRHSQSQHPFGMMLLHTVPILCLWLKIFGPVKKPHEVYTFRSRTSHPNPTSLEDLMKLVHNRSADDALKFLKEKQPRDASGSVGRHAEI